VVRKEIVWDSVTLARVLERFQDFFSFVFGVFWIAAVPSLFVGLYSYLVVYVMVLGAVYGWGVYVWVVPVVMLGPVVAVWYRVLQRRYRDYVEALTGSVKWDVEAAVKGWVELTRAGKKRDKKKG